MMTPSDYQNLFQTCRVTDNPKAIKELDYICRVAIANQVTYQTVQRFVSIPWPVIAAIHFRESDQNFSRHLHNGDPLGARTVHAPKGRPSTGQPPFTWIESAIDALDNIWRPRAWSIPGCLEFMERYNGTAYQKHGVNTPYLWDYTDKYVSGLYIADGIFDPEVAEGRPGCVALVKTLAARGVSLDFSTTDSVGSDLH